MTRPRPIVLFTDFGPLGPYVGHLHLALRKRVLDAPIIDLQHDAPAFRPDLAAPLLAAQFAWTPPDAVILSIVDPGVGTDRSGLVLSLGGRTLVGPDNGLFGPLFKRAFRVEQILWQPEQCSQTFHGRDWFAPVAAALSAGEPLMAQVCDPRGCRGYGAPDNLARVIYCDVYGNLMTGVAADTLSDKGCVKLAGQTLPFLRTFAEAPVGQAFVFANAFGLLEIAVNCGSAAELLGLAIGDAITLE